MSEELDYYALLDVAPTADEATIRAAFRQLARRYHPDVAGAANLERMQKLNVAYQTLSDPQRRLQYDLRNQARWTTRSAPHAAATPPLTATASARFGADSATSPFHRVQVIDLSERIPIGALAVARASQIVAIGTLDGRVLLWDMGARRVLSRLSPSAASVAGVLQELRLSPTGALVMAWGYQLGVRVWSAADGATLWNTAATAPSGMMDGVLFDSPAMMRLAFPQAPMALAGDDPFRWAHEGRNGTSVLSRPLHGPVAPGWAIPLECTEVEGGPPRREGAPGVQLRALSDDGRTLLSCLAQKEKNGAPARALHLWDLDHRSMRGAAQPRIVSSVRQPAEDLDFPIAFTPDLTRGVAARHGAELAVFALQNRRARVIPVGFVAPDAHASLSPDGAYVALAHDTTARVWHVATGKLVQTWRATAEIGQVVFARRQGSQLLVIGTADGMVEVWSS